MHALAAAPSLSAHHRPGNLPLTSAEASPVGLVLGSVIAPEDLRAAATTAEQLGFGRLWMAEDCFTCGGIAGAAAVLGATRKIPVGLGIVNGMVRHPALLAMELSTLGRMYPGRLVPAIGLGLPDWLRQLGVHPASPVRALEECVRAVRSLLAGEEVTAAGQFQLNAVKLSFPTALPIHMGVMGPRMLRLSGAIADGTVLSVLASPAYVSWARERIAEGAAAAGRPASPHRVSTFALCSVDRDGERARAQMRPLLAFFLDAVKRSTLVSALGIADELLELAADGPDALAERMPAEWVDELAIAGDPAHCAAQIRRLMSAGSDTVELFPAPPERAAEFTAIVAEEIMPRLTGVRAT